MNEEVKEGVDQHVLAEDISNKIEYEFLDFFLVKPLDPIKVKKEFLKDSNEKTMSKDANGIEAVDYNENDIEVREVDSDFRKGVVLKVPESFYKDKNVGETIKVGDTIVFNERAGKLFDLLKDSRLIRYYDIIATVK